MGWRPGKNMHQQYVTYTNMHLIAKMLSKKKTFSKLGSNKNKKENVQLEWRSFVFQMYS